MNKNCFDQDLINVEKPARYIDGEWNSRQYSQKEIESSRCRFALVFPDSYEVAQSSLGMKILYSIAGHIPGVVVERAVSPMPDMEEYLRSRSLPLLTLETGAPLSEMDVVGFTLQYQLTFTNILQVLDLSGIPFYTVDRNAEDPVLIAGGPGAYNPEPVADFFDAILIGDGEEALPEILETVSRWKEAVGKSRQELLAHLSEIRGVYVPSFYKINYDKKGRVGEIIPQNGAPSVVNKRILADLNKGRYPVRPVVPYLQTIHDRIMLEIFRGCSRGCRFCQAGYVYRPIRERNLDNLVDLADRTIASTGYDELSLLSFSSSDYSLIEELLKSVNARYSGQCMSFSLPSLRMDSFSLGLAGMIKETRKTGLTFAPEAGTQRLRNVINKNITERDITQTLHQAEKMGWQSVKLYFMMGLPSETDKDIQGIVDLVKDILKATRLRLHVSVSNFVPQPFTPFQWEDMHPIEELQNKAHFLRRRLKHKRIKFNWHEPRVSILEGVFTRGDRRLSRVVEGAFRLGCRFDGWDEYFSYDKWIQAFEDARLTPEFYLRERDPDETLPWSHINAGVEEAFLNRERKKACNGETTVDCREKCVGCGVCDNKEVFNKTAVKDVTREYSCANPPAIHERVQKLRLKVTKKGSLKWISHLDYMRCMERALKRAAVPVSYSGGFHPRPRLVFALPLPLGYTSEAEWVDVLLYEEMDPEDLFSDFSKNLPVGLEILRCAEVPVNDKSLVAGGLKSVFWVDLKESFHPEEKDMEEKIKEFLSLDEIILKKKKKEKNVRDFILDVRLTNVGESLEIEVLKTGSGSVKPDVIVEMILSREAAEKACYHRKKMLTKLNSEWVEPL